MVLESLLNPINAEGKPWEMFFIGFLYSSVAILLSMWIFRDQTSLVMVFLTVMACIPIVYNTMKLEESKDISILEERMLIKEHNRAIAFFMFLFFGITLSFDHNGHFDCFLSSAEISLRLLPKLLRIFLEKVRASISCTLPFLFVSLRLVKNQT